MTMSILKDATSRADYKRKWQIMNNASKKGFNVALVDAFYSKMIAKGYKQDTIFDALFYAAGAGVFGYIKNNER